TDHEIWAEILHLLDAATDRVPRQIGLHLIVDRRRNAHCFQVRHDGGTGFRAGEARVGAEEGPRSELSRDTANRPPLASPKQNLPRQPDEAERIHAPPPPEGLAAVAIALLAIV